MKLNSNCTPFSVVSCVPIGRETSGRGPETRVSCTVPSEGVALFRTIVGELGGTPVEMLGPFRIGIARCADD